MRVGDVDIAVFARPMRAQMTHDEFLAAYEGAADQLERDADQGMVGVKPRYAPGQREIATKMKVKVAAVRDDPTATRRLAEKLNVHLSEDTSTDPDVLHAVNVFVTTLALLTRQPLRALCGAPLPARPVPAGALRCPRCAAAN